jgi:hypothetical protein
MKIVPDHIFNKIINLYTCGCLISGAQNYVYSVVIEILYGFYILHVLLLSDDMSLYYL